MDVEDLAGKRVGGVDGTDAAAIGKARLEEEERLRLEAERAAAIEAGTVEPDELTPEEQEHLNERQVIEELIRTKPAEIALLVKTWLSED